MASMDNPIDDGRSPRCKRFNQHVGAFVASLGGFALGTAIGWYSKAASVLKNTLTNGSVTEINLVGGGLYIGATCGAMFLPFLLKTFSHITLMILTIPLFTVGWSFICYAEQKIHLLIIGRVICGICGALHSIVAPLYISEIADKDIRGRLLTFFHLLVNCGILYAYLIAHIIDEDETIFRYSVICWMSSILITMVAFLPESPICLLNKADEHAAYQTLKCFKAKYLITDEIMELKMFVQATPRNVYKLLTNCQVQKSMFACLWIIIIQHLSGINIMIPNALMIFNIGGSGDMTGSQQTVVIGAVQIVSCILAMILVDIIGRRVLFTMSSISVGILLQLLGVFFHLREKHVDFEEQYYWIPPVLIILLFAFFNVGLGPISWSLSSDSFPEEIKVAAASAFAAFNWFISFVATIYFGEVYVTLDISNTLTWVGRFCFIVSALVSTLILNTHGKSLGEIQHLFGPTESNASPAMIRSISNEIYHGQQNSGINV